MVQRSLVMQLILLYLATAVIFFAIDMIWLGLVAHKFYQTELSFILSPQVNWLAAGIFYAIYLAGVLYFAVFPALKSGGLSLALLHGALLGGLCYATYDLTNMATIAKWPLKVVLVDILWGIFLTGSVAALSYWVGKNWIGIGA
jgi:uncharacterized membrane protein